MKRTYTYFSTHLKLIPGSLGDLMVSDFLLPGHQMDAFLVHAFPKSILNSQGFYPNPDICRCTCFRGKGPVSGGERPHRLQRDSAGMECLSSRYCPRGEVNTCISAAFFDEEEAENYCRGDDSLPPVVITSREEWIMSFPREENLVFNC